MRPRTTRPLICVPLVARDSAQLLEQAAYARELSPDVVEWRADSFDDVLAERMCTAAQNLRGVLDRLALIFTLRRSDEGGARQLSPAVRGEIIAAVVGSGYADLVDVELRNGPDFVHRVISSAREHGVRVILSFHDFEGTPPVEFIVSRIAEMVDQGADIAKVACMPREPEDVLRLLEATLKARRMFPAVPLCTMSMGSLGSLSRVAGFLFGSDMSFAAGLAASAPGQIPFAELKSVIGALRLDANRSGRTSRP
jgi:3-dehydroquinate dehydratase-1